MLLLNGMTLDDVQRIVDKISKEVSDEMGNIDARVIKNRVYNLFAIEISQSHDEDGKIVVDWVNADDPIKEWKKEEDEIDFRTEINGKTVEELEALYIATRQKKNDGGIS